MITWSTILIKTSGVRRLNMVPIAADARKPKKRNFLLKAYPVSLLICPIF